MRFYPPLTPLENNRRGASHNRLLFIDACRGMCILTVVYIHSTLLCGTNSANLTNVLSQLFRMGLFFFISGYLVYGMKYDAALVAKRSTNRLVHQLYPTIIIWAIYLFTFYLPPWCIDLSLKEIACDQFKGGYWFTFVMVEVFFLSIPLLYYFSRTQLSRWKQVVMLLTVYLAVAAGNLVMTVYGRGVFVVEIFYGLTSFELFTTYLPFFFLGMLAKMFKEQFMKVVSNKWTICVALFLFVVLSGIPHITLHRDKISLRFVCCGLSGILLALSVFYFLCKIKWHPIVWTTTKMSVLGKSTLEIYLLHYFFLSIIADIFDFGKLLPFISTVWELPIFITMSIVVTQMCMLVVKFLKRFNLYRFVFPNLEDLPQRVTRIWA